MSNFHQNVLLVTEIVGLVAFAISGALAAFKKDLDIIGYVVVGTLAGIGGGTIRDLILGRPVFWINEIYLYPLNICIAASALTYVISKFIEKRENIINWFDAVGLAMFSVQGYMIAISCVPNVELAIAMGTITGCGGGLLRDIALNRQPFIFRGELYATNALIGLVFLWLTNSPIGAGILIFGLRAGTISYGWKLK